MVDVPSARKYGFRMTLHEGPMRELVNSPAVVRVLAEETAKARGQVESHARATTSAESAENYVAALETEATTSDALGFDFKGPYSLGNRPASTITVPPGLGSNKSAKPPLMVEAQTHALTSVPGFTVGKSGEDIR